MSCFICSDNHIITIALTNIVNIPYQFEHNPIIKPLTYDYISKQPLDKIIQTLLNANIKSFNHRYPNNKVNRYEISKSAIADIKTELSELYKEYGKDKFIVYLIKQLDCYAYQSCEFPPWENCKAKLIVDNAKSKLVSQLIYNRQDYNQLPWGIE